MKGWKTTLFNVALVALGILPGLQAQLSEVFPQWMADHGLVWIGIGGLVLRAVTNTPIGQKESEGHCCPVEPMLCTSNE
jgi:hypothetical protein